jgi:hypothetical protein
MKGVFMSRVGIEEIKDVVIFGAKFGNSLSKSLADGKIGFGDLAELMPVLTSIIPAIEGIDEVGVELSDLDDAEMMELEKVFKETLNITNDNLETIIERCFSATLSIYDLVLSFNELKLNK